ncbi:MAG TPA: serine hydrolase domain-containing protein [Candidatus Baltobacteraceae bacterium]|jgi:CubicO group peptidase (beta-lactamase class C family)
MRARRIGAILACLLASACQGSSTSIGPSTIVPTAPPSVPASAIDAIVEHNYAGGWGVELAIFKNGALRFARGYGLRDRGLPDAFNGPNPWGLPQPDQTLAMPRGAFPPDSGTVFDLASVSKEFTAGAILLLQQDGELSVNDTLDKYFPTLPNARQISLLYLLQHRSGFVEYNNFGTAPDFTDAYNAFMASGQTNYQPIVDRLATFPLKFTPGTQYDYSNTNYLLLALIVARVSGRPFGTFLQQRLFAPLGMTHTNQGNPSSPVTDLALGYRLRNGNAVRAWQWNLQWLAGPGGITSTVGDIELWDRAVRQPGIFTADSRKQMFAPSPFPQSYGTYADGWFIATLDGRPFIWHDGALGGYQTVNATFPQDDLDIVILTNDGTGLDPYYMIQSLFPIARTM